MKTSSEGFVCPHLYISQVEAVIGKAGEEVPVEGPGLEGRAQVGWKQRSYHRLVMQPGASRSRAVPSSRQRDQK